MSQALVILGYNVPLWLALLFGFNSLISFLLGVKLTLYIKK